MSANTFYDLWVATLGELARAREDAEEQREAAARWRKRAESRELEAELLRLLLQDVRCGETPRQL